MYKKNKKKLENVPLKAPLMLLDPSVTASIRPNLDIVFDSPDITLNLENVNSLRELGKIFMIIRKRLISEGVEIPKSRVKKENNVKK